jgi:hypothetical protein
MPSSPGTEDDRGRSRRTGLLVLGVIALLASGPATRLAAQTAPGFQVRSAEVQLSGDVYVLSGRIDYRFSDALVEAMESGVALTVVVEALVVERRVFLDRDVASTVTRQRIKKHALTKQYVVRRLDTGGTRTFRSFADMLAALSIVEDQPVVAADRIRPDARYGLRVRARLDVEALPSPLRPLAYMKTLGKLSSDWYERSFEP